MGSLQVGQYISDDSNSIPVGTIVMYLGTTAPTGWLLCNGNNYASGAFTHPALYAVIGTQFGADLAGDFKVPDFRDRIPVGAGGSFSSTIGTTGGAASVTLTAAESGYPSHSHSVSDTYATTASAVDAGSALYSDWNPIDVTRTTDPNTAVNASSSHENRMPYVIVNYIIKAF